MNAEQAFADAMKKYQEAYEEMLPLEANYKDLDSQTKSIRAKAFMMAKKDGAGVKEAEMIAEFDPDVMNHLTVLNEAFKLYNDAKSRKEIADKRWDTGRSLISLEKAKCNIM